VGKGLETGWRSTGNYYGTVGKSNSSQCCWIELRKWENAWKLAGVAPATLMAKWEETTPATVVGFTSLNEWSWYLIFPHVAWE
jgi:hypothetical protein